MAKTNDFWVSEGVAFNGAGYIKTSLTCAIVTTAFGAGALLAPAFDQDIAGTIVSLVFAGVSVCTDIYALYGPRLGWTKALNAAILESGIDWKAAKAR